MTSYQHNSKLIKELNTLNENIDAERNAVSIQPFIILLQPSHDLYTRSCNTT